jgi:hypothetical protein
MESGEATGDDRPTRPRTWWRRLTFLLVVAVTGLSITGYVVLSITVNALPPLQPFPGWLAVLEPVGELSITHVKLEVQSYVTGSHPFVSYTVLACGSRPYTADLLIGGSARLTGIRRYRPPFAPSEPLRLRRLSDLVLSYGSPINYGPVQLIRISLPAFKCLPTSADQGSAGFAGSAESVTGFAGGPIQQSWHGLWGWWHGPHLTEAWPLTGALPGTTAYGAFTGLAGLSGLWVRPNAAITISDPNTPLNLSIDSAIPEPSDPNVPSWTGTDGMNPVARLTDTSSVSQIQDWIVVLAVGLGIGGGMLASLLFEWLRPRRTHQTATLPKQASTQMAMSPEVTTRHQSHRAAVLMVVIISWAWLRHAKRRS